MDNSSIEVSLEVNSTLVKEGADHLPVVLFKIYILYAKKTIVVVNIPLFNFAGDTTNQGIIGTIQ